MRTPHRSLSNLTHMLPGYMYPLFVQQLNHALAPPDTGIAQDLQDRLKGWTMVLNEISQHMYFAALHVRIDLDARDKVNIEGVSRCGCLLQTTCAIVIGQCQHSQSDLFGLV